MNSIRYVENGKVVAEFVDAQAFHDFVQDKTIKHCNANYVLNQRKRDNRIKSSWFFAGVFSIEAFFLIIILIEKIS